MTRHYALSRPSTTHCHNLRLCSKMSAKEWNRRNLYEIEILRNREIGNRRKIGDEDNLFGMIYSNMHSRKKIELEEGGIFNLEFNRNGTILVSAWERCAVMLFDTFSGKRITEIFEAHDKCVNNIKFLDDNKFATCSDDTTIKLWDLRRLDSSLKTLNGHTYWVKNIEYIQSSNTLVTSSLDGKVLAWDLNNPTENNYLSYDACQLDGLMRMKLTNDGSKMILSTTAGYMFVIHDLHLEKLKKDLEKFQPSLYRLAQKTKEPYPKAAIWNRLFQQKRNRVEFIDDFPTGVEVTTSLQIHPMNWCALSRCVSLDDRHEWTCVHDIQMRDQKDYENSYYFFTDDDIMNNGQGGDFVPGSSADLWISSSLKKFVAAPYRSNSVLDIVSIVDSGIMHNNYHREWNGRMKIVKNLPRLTNQIEELGGLGKGYIKELCFSPDGRVVCSPYGKGVRLLGFNEKVQELCYCVPEEPRELHVVKTLEDLHDDTVVCCKFNPTHHQIVSGCLSGSIVWYYPKF